MLEILAPAGSLESATVAINNGADAVYLGLTAFSARQNAENFDGEGFRTLIRKAHFNGVKVYVALNTVVKEKELESFFNSLCFAWSEGADAIILQDALLGKYIHAQAPQIVLHLSTQAGVCTEEGARFAKECGFSRVILARETPISEIEKIAKIIETEVFVQGALCTAFSGQCYFSSFAGGNSGNRGRCKQPCRKLYSYDRNGNTEKNYAISLSDLCVGEQIRKLIDAGVSSFKIEGRMRRAEYVGAAVRYYRTLLEEGRNDFSKLSDLKRTYNRGNYTTGLAFGQNKTFLSPFVQGHMGEKVGVVKVMNGKFCVESNFKPMQGDAFKILRNGKEVAGATYQKTEGRYFIIASKIRLKNGDGVFVTTDNALLKRLVSTEKKGTLFLRLFFEEGKKPIVQCDDFYYTGTEDLPTAENRPLTKEELITCFSKTDGLPVEIQFDEIYLQGNIFLPKSLLNGIRREFYFALSDYIAKGEREEVRISLPVRKKSNQTDEKTAVIATDFTGISPNIAIFKGTDYSLPLSESFKNGNFEKYIYYPPFATEKDLRAIESWIKECPIDGIYAENYGGISFAKERGLKIFGGTGLNLLNGISLSELKKTGDVTYYALSKEGNAEELSLLTDENAFVLSSGNIKIMDLCYCPFGKTCKECDKKAVYTLTDENERRFPVRRYLSGEGGCRFEVYNCADLIGSGVRNAGSLLDLTLVEDKRKALSIAKDEKEQKEFYKNYTSGHYKRGVL